MRNFPDQFTAERKLEVEALLEHCLHGLGVLALGSSRIPSSFAKTDLKFAWSWRRRLLWPLKMPERNYGFRGIAQNAQSQRRKAGFVYRAHCQIQQSIADYCRRHPGVESPGCRRCFAERGTSRCRFCGKRRI